MLNSWTAMSAPSERRPRAARSLLMFVQALEGMTLIVELRTDTVVRGRVEAVDNAMKCALLTLRCCVSAADAPCVSASPSLTRSVTPLRCAVARDTRRRVLNLTCVAQGVRTQLPSLFVRGRLVRYIHLPEALDPGRAIESHRKKLVDATLHYARKGAGARPPHAAGGAEAAAQHGGAHADAGDTQELT